MAHAGGVCNTPHNVWHEKADEADRTADGDSRTRQDDNQKGGEPADALCILTERVP